jgi:hypothetical protein
MSDQTTSNQADIRPPRVERCIRAWAAGRPYPQDATAQEVAHVEGLLDGSGLRRETVAAFIATLDSRPATSKAQEKAGGGGYVA